MGGSAIFLGLTGGEMVIFPGLKQGIFQVVLTYQNTLFFTFSD